MTNDEIGRKLDTIASILRLAHRDAIARERASIRGDKINAAILDAVGIDSRTGSGALQKAVAKKTRTGERTVRDRLGELADMGALEKQGGGSKTEYRSTGLI